MLEELLIRRATGRYDTGGTLAGLSCCVSEDFGHSRIERQHIKQLYGSRVLLPDACQGSIQQTCLSPLPRLSPDGI